MQALDGLINQWKQDEQASFKGWDFSYLKDRVIDEDPSWSYEDQAKELIRKAISVLDMGTGGGERFSKLGPFPKHTVATEGYKPNVKAARETLEPLGIKVIEADESGSLPCKDEEFDLVLNRHSAFDEKEVFRILKPGGIFFTQQVGGGNLSDLIEEFKTESQYKKWTLDKIEKSFEEAGFELIVTRDWRGKMTFKDVGALVYFLKAIPWIVPGFSVDRDLKYLIRFQQKLEQGESLSFKQERYLIQAQKPS